MKIYLVGGAVRDKLLGLPIIDRDWLVVGATVQDMLQQNYLQVGKDFPVFIHPQTKEEYALARTEKKTGHGYTGFSVHASAEVTLTEDLLRRDLTINAIAEDENGTLFDPFNGRIDLENKILRHVSSAFSEDPLRVLRVSRFAARFSSLGFTVADETLLLMQNIVAAKELQYLSPERVWQEIQRALNESSPQIFFQCLRDCNALIEIMPELNKLFGVPQSAQSHPEIDTGVHTLMVLEQACILTPDPVIRFAALVHDLGKAETDPSLWPKHHNHENLGVKKIQALCSRLKTPNEYCELAMIVSLYHTDCHNADQHSANTLFTTLENVDALRRPKRFEQFLLTCEADAKGRLGFDQEPYPQANILREALQLILTIKAKEIISAGFEGEEISNQLKIKRIEKLFSHHSNFK